MPCRATGEARGFLALEAEAGEGVDLGHSPYWGFCGKDKSVLGKQFTVGQFE